jgi:hypothetical protein
MGLLEQDAKCFCYYLEKEERKGKTLSKTSRSFEKAGRGSIDKNNKGGTLNAPHSPVNRF